MGSPEKHLIEKFQILALFSTKNVKNDKVIRPYFIISWPKMRPLNAQ